MGDSITAGVGVTKDETDYVALLAKSLEMDYIRLGASGTTLCTDGSRTCNIDKFGGDGVHPGAVGHQMMAAAIENILLGNHLLDDHDHSYGSWITTTYPDCVSGEQQRVCAVCTATESREMDGTGHAYENGICTGCGAWDPDAAEPMTLRYDDHVDMTGRTVEIISGGLTLADNYLVASAVGEAIVRIDNQLYRVTVQKAKVNLIMIMGQSNAGNHFANAISDVTCPVGTAYWWGNEQGTVATEPVPYTQPSLGFHTPLLAELYAQSAAAGDPVKNVLIWEEGITSKNGQSIVKWAAGAQDTSGTDDAVTMLENCRAYYEANGDKYEIVSSGVYWLQGESDSSMDPALYTQRFMAMWQRLKDAGMEYVAFLRVRRASSVNPETRDDLYYSSALSAQLQMICENPEFYLATTVTENWTGTPAASHTVDISNYITMVETYGKSETYTDAFGNSASYADGKLTTTMKSLYGSNATCHYGKFGYGIIGADAAYNMYRAFHSRDAAVVVTDTSGHADRKQNLTEARNVTVDIRTGTEDLSFRPLCGSTAGTLKLVIRSGETDITNEEGLILTGGEHYGCVSVSKLRGYEAVTITAVYATVSGEVYSAVCQVVTPPREPQKDYIWTFDKDLHARSADGEIQNTLLETTLTGSYALEEGCLTGSNLQLELEQPIELDANENWTVEWKYGSLNGGTAGFLLCSERGNTLGNKGFWHTKYGNLAIADYLDSTGYRNYTSRSVTIRDNDCLKVVNRCDPETGKNTVSLWINDELAIADFQLKGSINNYDDSLDMTQYPLSADFVFKYLGNTGRTDWTMNCQLDYLKISFGEEESDSGEDTASVGYGFYLVDETGNPLNEQGQTVSFENSKKFDINGLIAVEKDTGPTVILAEDRFPAELLEEYDLYDPASGYTISVSTVDGESCWIITKGEGKKASTYVTEYGGDPTTENSENCEVASYENTVVYFALKAKAKAKPDTVVIDFGLPVIINVLANDPDDLEEVTAIAKKDGDLPANGQETAPSFDGTEKQGNYGTLELVDADEVKYTPTSMQMPAEDVFVYAAKTNEGKYYYSTVTVIPATTIYYEDSFVSYTAWSTSVIRSSLRFITWRAWITERKMAPRANLISTWMPSAFTTPPTMAQTAM